MNGTVISGKRKYKIRTGRKGGAYILKRGKKKYLSSFGMKNNKSDDAAAGVPRIPSGSRTRPLSPRLQRQRPSSVQTLVPIAIVEIDLDEGERYLQDVKSWQHFYTGGSPPSSPHELIWKHYEEGSKMLGPRLAVPAKGSRRGRPARPGLLFATYINIKNPRKAIEVLIKAMGLVAGKAAISAAKRQKEPFEGLENAADGWHCFVLFRDGALVIKGGAGMQEPGFCSGHPLIYNILSLAPKKEDILLAGEVHIEGSASGIENAHIGIRGWNPKSGTYRQSFHEIIQQLKEADMGVCDIFGRTPEVKCLYYDPELNEFVYPPPVVHDVARGFLRDVAGGVGARPIYRDTQLGNVPELAERRKAELLHNFYLRFGGPRRRKFRIY